MSQYYLMAQLPSLYGISDAAPLPITEERFYELCGRFLSKKSLKVLDGLTLIPPRDSKPTGSSLVDAWNEGERQLRLALGSIRAGKMNKSFESENRFLQMHLVQTARAAAEMEDPMEAEKFLNSFRLNFLESLNPSDAFSEDAVFCYGLKLKLISRMRQFDMLRGQDAYRNIYDSIMRGDKQEAEQ